MINSEELNTLRYRTGSHVTFLRWATTNDDKDNIIAEEHLFSFGE